MLCGACGMDNPSQNRFCDQCGAVLDAVCPSCGGTIRPEARFCGTCGKRIGEAAAAERRAEPEARSARPPASPPLAYRSPVVAYTPRHLADKILRSRSALEGERRQVTVLFADIAGFTTLAEKLDPEDVHRIVDRCFELLDLGEVAVKGRAPARAFEVLRARARRSRLAAAVERGLTPLVGRSREVDILLERFAEVKRGHGQVVSLAGDAGIGKSRLLLEFRRAVMEADEHPTWLEGQSVSFGQSIPFLPLIEQLRLNFHIEEFDGEPEIIAKVEHGMRRMGELETHIPYIRYLLSVDPGDRSILEMEAGARRRKGFEAIRALSLRGARLRPLVLVFEDLHWIDAGTEEYLASMADAVASVPLMLILTYRVGYSPPVPARSFHTALTLHPLSEADAV